MWREKSQRFPESDLHTCKAQMQPGVVVAGDATGKAARVFGATVTKRII